MNSSLRSSISRGDCPETLSEEYILVDVFLASREETPALAALGGAHGLNPIGIPRQQKATYDLQGIGDLVGEPTLGIPRKSARIIFDNQRGGSSSLRQFFKPERLPPPSALPRFPNFASLVPIRNLRLTFRTNAV